jgi:glycosyltransferase involved in cell wall biosynthesis
VIGEQRRIRVLLVAQAAPARGGIPSFVEGLLRDEELGRAVRFGLVNTTRTAEREAGRFTLSNAWHAVQDGVRVARAARSADVVHVQTALLPLPPLLRALALCLAGRAGGAAVICHVHSGRLNSGAQEAFQPSAAYRALLRLLPRVAERVLVVADPGRRLLEELAPGISVRTLHNAVDVERFALADPGATPPRLAYVGTLSRRKGLADLLDALELVGDADYELVVAGGGHEVGQTEADELRERARRSGRRVRLVGSLDAAAVRSLLASSQVFVLPSHWEGQPIAILEAMAAGLPVVVSSVGANPDVVRDGQDGLVVASHDAPGLAAALRRLIADPGLRTRMGASARERAAQDYDRRVLGDAILAEYRALLGRHQDDDPPETERDPLVALA